MLQEKSSMLWCRIPHICTFLSPAHIPERNVGVFAPTTSSQEKKQNKSGRPLLHSLVYCTTGDKTWNIFIISIHSYVVQFSSTVVKTHSCAGIVQMLLPITEIFRNIERWNCYWKLVQAQNVFGAMSAFSLAGPNWFTERRWEREHIFFFFVYIFIRIILHSSFDGNRCMENGGSWPRG